MTQNLKSLTHSEIFDLFEDNEVIDRWYEYIKKNPYNHRYFVAKPNKSILVEVLEDFEKFTKGSILEFHYRVSAYSYDSDPRITYFLTSSRGSCWYDDYECSEWKNDDPCNIDVFKFLKVSNAAKTYTAKREKPIQKPEIIMRRIYDSTGQRINPGDYVIFATSYGNLEHCRFEKQRSNFVLDFTTQHRNASTSRNMTTYANPNEPDVFVVPNSLKISASTLSHLVQAKLRGNFKVRDDE